MVKFPAPRAASLDPATDASFADEPDPFLSVQLLPCPKKGPATDPQGAPLTIGTVWAGAPYGRFSIMVLLKCQRKQRKKGRERETQRVLVWFHA